MKKITIISSIILLLSLVSIVQAEVQKDIPYSISADPLKRLDIFTPDQNDEKLPVLIHIHGGGWKTGNKSIQRKHGEFYSSRSIIFININYRLTPKVIHPAHVEDCAEAIAWVFQNINKLGGDKNRIFVSGHSAGAHLAGLLGTNASFLNKYNIRTTQLAGIIPIDTASFDLLSRSNDWFTKRLIKNAFGTDKATLISASPLHQVNKDQSYPEFLIFASGNRSSAIKQGQELSQKLNDTGSAANAIVIEGYNHRDMNIGMREEDGPISNAILDFIK
jgi:arylformamidase